MALRRTTQPHTTKATLLVLPERVHAMSRIASSTDEAVMDQSRADRFPGADRKMRNLIILATAFSWIAIIAAIRFFFF